MTHPALLRSKSALIDHVRDWKAQGCKIGLVPTMGALHHGHLSLVDVIRPHVDKIVVSIFVNPTQFGEGEDFGDYPRDEDGDIAKLSAAGVDAVYLPQVSDLYPAGFTTSISVGPMTQSFEGEHRPGHFEGVSTVVSKLILQSRADTAIFGEKDFQQLAVIRRTVADLDIACDILGAPIAREPDGLAASSRNVYLKADERRIAGQFNGILRELVATVRAGTRYRAAELTARNALLAAGVKAVDYVDIIDPATFTPAEDGAKAAHVIAVVRVGRVRLLDNMAVLP